jgi:serine/threonine-protein kinase
VDGGTTGTGKLAGSLDYLAPEQIRTGHVDGRADQYALACVNALARYRRGTSAAQRASLSARMPYGCRTALR